MSSASRGRPPQQKVCPRRGGEAYEKRFFFSSGMHGQKSQIFVSKDTTVMWRLHAEEPAPFLQCWFRVDRDYTPPATSPHTLSVSPPLFLSPLSVPFVMLVRLLSHRELVKGFASDSDFIFIKCDNTQVGKSSLLLFWLWCLSIDSVGLAAGKLTTAKVQFNGYIYNHYIYNMYHYSFKLLITSKKHCH